MGFKVQAFDRAVRARKSSTGRPQVINGWYAGSPVQKSTPAVSTRPATVSAKLDYPGWLKASGKPASTEAAREYVCYRRGALFLTPRQREQGCIQTTATVLA